MISLDLNSSVLESCGAAMGGEIHLRERKENTEENMVESERGTFRKRDKIERQREVCGHPFVVLPSTSLNRARLALPSAARHLSITQFSVFRHGPFFTGPLKRLDPYVVYLVLLLLVSGG